MTLVNNICKKLTPHWQRDTALSNWIAEFHPFQIDLISEEFDLWTLSFSIFLNNFVLFKNIIFEKMNMQIENLEKAPIKISRSSERNSSAFTFTCCFVRNKNIYFFLQISFFSRISLPFYIWKWKLRVKKSKFKNVTRDEIAKKKMQKHRNLTRIRCS